MTPSFAAQAAHSWTLRTGAELFALLAGCVAVFWSVQAVRQNRRPQPVPLPKIDPPKVAPRIRPLWVWAGSLALAAILPFLAWTGLFTHTQAAVTFSGFLSPLFSLTLVPEQILTSYGTLVGGASPPFKLGAIVAAGIGGLCFPMASGLLARLGRRRPNATQQTDRSAPGLGTPSTVVDPRAFILLGRGLGLAGLAGGMLFAHSQHLRTFHTLSVLTALSFGDWMMLGLCWAARLIFPGGASNACTQGAWARISFMSVILCALVTGLDFWSGENWAHPIDQTIALSQNQGMIALPFFIGAACLISYGRFLAPGFLKPAHLKPTPYPTGGFWKLNLSPGSLSAGLAGTIILPGLWAFWPKEGLVPLAGAIGIGLLAALALDWVDVRLTQSPLAPLNLPWPQPAASGRGSVPSQNRPQECQAWKQIQKTKLLRLLARNSLILVSLILAAFIDPTTAGITGILALMTALCATKGLTRPRPQGQYGP